MPDFDSFERLFKAVMSADLTSDAGALQIYRLADDNKVRVVKGKSVEELTHFLKRSRESLLKFFPQGARFTYSDNNRDGKDLLEISSGIHVELKSGKAMTDANSGLSIVRWALQDDSMSLKTIMNGGMKHRRSILLSNEPLAQIEASKARTMDELASYFQARLRLGPAPDRLAHYFRCVAVGLTKSKEIIRSFGSTASGSAPLLLEANWERGLELYEKAFLPDEPVEIVRIERTVDRAQVVAMGSQTGRLAKLYPNFKNSWKAPNGKKYEASNWIVSACFHVWVD